MSFALVARDLYKSFNGSKSVARGLSLEIKEGEIVALLGESGCGKSTFLRLISGFEIPERGEIYIGDKQVFGASVNLQPAQRNIGIVFQNFALFPHLSVAENIAFGASKMSKKELEGYLERIGLRGYENCYPYELSGGEQQRVALARALVLKPRLLLLDEPFSSLDVHTRSHMREEIRTLIQESGVAALLVTHDRQDAFYLADSIALLSNGRILQKGTPQELYFKPKNLESALFLGSAQEINKPLGAYRGIVRPEWFSLADSRSGVRALVVRSQFLGIHQAVWVEIEEESYEILLPSDIKLHLGEYIYLQIKYRNKD